jgi:hypothetical protein
VVLRQKVGSAPSKPTIRRRSVQAAVQPWQRRKSLDQRLSFRGAGREIRPVESAHRRKALRLGLATASPRMRCSRTNSIACRACRGTSETLRPTSHWTTSTVGSDSSEESNCTAADRYRCLQSELPISNRSYNSPAQRFQLISYDKCTGMQLIGRGRQGDRVTGVQKYVTGHWSRPRRTNTRRIGLPNRGAFDLQSARSLQERRTGGRFRRQCLDSKPHLSVRRQHNGRRWSKHAAVERCFNASGHGAIPIAIRSLSFFQVGSKEPMQL